MKIEIYTDGACDKNPGGNGGWAAILVANGELIEKWCGYEFETTNQRMELTAAITGLKETYIWLEDKNEFLDISLYSDSAYLINCVNQHWYVNWERNGWYNSKKEPVANRDLWEKLVPYFNTALVQFKKVKGHDGNQWNEFVDGLAVSARLAAKEMSEIEKSF